MLTDKISIQLSTLLTWAVLMFLLGALAGNASTHVVADPAPPTQGASIGECAELCGDSVKSWTPYVCECRPNTGDSDD